MTTSVFAGTGYVNESFDVNYEVQELRDGEWVTTSIVPATANSSFHETIWVGKRVLITEEKKPT